MNSGSRTSIAKSQPVEIGLDEMEEAGGGFGHLALVGGTVLVAVAVGIAAGYLAKQDNCDC